MNIMFDYKFGNFILFTRNIVDLSQLEKLTRDIHEEVMNSIGIMPFIAIDQEGGTVVRIMHKSTFYPGSMTLAATDLSNAEIVGHMMGKHLISLGINMNFAPVLDINNNPKNPIIGIRSYSDKPEIVSKYGIELIDEVWNGVDKDFVEGIDADDNGVFPKIDAIYKVKTISNIIKLFNPSYDSDEEESTQFEKACGVAKSILEEEILYINGKCYAEKQVMEYLDEMDINAKYLILDHFLPYEDALLGEERANSILYVAYPSNRGGYAIKVLPKNANDRSARVPFPEEWAGLEGQELEEVSGISGLTFCHMGRFIVNCRDLDTVYQVFEKIC